MISNQKLTRIIRAAEAATERDADLASPRKLTGTPAVENGYAAPIVTYLLAPYENGYWQLQADWNPISPFSEFLLESSGTLIDLEDIDDMPLATPTVVARKMPEDKREELLRITNRLTPIFAIFRAIVLTCAGKELPRFSESDSWIKKLDLKVIQSKFKDAFEIFESKIYFDGLLPGVGSRLYRIKTGLVSYLEAPKKSGNLHVVGTQLDDLRVLREFYDALGVLKSPIVRRVFAPDEALFRPYFSLVSGVLPHVIQDNQISHSFAQALDYYEKEDYQHCISTLGLIAEDYLQRIYTSILREQIASGLTLGQTLDRLHKQIDELFPSAKLTQRSFDRSHEYINAIDLDCNAETLKPVLRELLALIQDDRNYYNRKIDEILKPASHRTPFPSRISNNLNELLRWRNAASHNSRVPLGAHEADRTLYCLVSLVTWWQDQLATTDWSKSRMEILEALLVSAKSSSKK